ncbi:PLP-dependent aminotransferase family protein [Sinomonas sp. JGH33]|uniref:PLP-dependent aminotransferase family protein n=1 Tax=Sinomonas terricola TaxID=3110330 RepID=A0ABU5T4E2_9MICC|nr:PLP-dependent aminotransferase family protein [Sinomonas sp. JGH33]MEA5454445.1 PLP-dependent aminotransferase family protein [Sinomonas sp. JGH33]
MIAITARRLASILGPWRSSGSPAYAALADRVRLVSLDGRLAHGTRLPAERDLAAALRVSRTTVASAYGRLREVGAIESRRGSGSFVSLGTRPSADPAADGIPLDFTKAAMPAALPVAACYAAAAQRIGPELARSGYEIVGHPELREAIAAHFSRRGVATDADQILVTSGAQHAIALLARLLASPGDRALIEHPTYPHAIDAISSARARPVPVPVDPDAGWDLDEAEAALRDAAPTVGYVMPDFQNPTGASLPDDARARLARAADRHGTVLIADETTMWLDLRRGPRQPLAAFSPSVVTVGGLGKLAWGGLRVGWIRAGRTFIARLAQSRTSMDLGTPVFEQLVAVELMAREADLVAERRARLSEGLATMRSALAEHFPAWTIPDPEGGLALWIDCAPWSSSELVLGARDEGLALTAGPRFGLHGAFEHRLRLPFTESPATIRDAVEALRRSADRHASGPLPEPLVAV